MRTKESIEAQASVKTPEKSAELTGKALGRKNLVAPWKPGQSGNPGGRPKDDVAQIIARKVFEQNPELIYKAFASALAKGGAFAFQVLSDRAYGKLKESKEVNHTYNETADADLAERIAALERDLGLAGEIDQAGRAGITQARAEKTNGAAKDHDLLPR